MKFYNREQELGVLAQTREIAFTNHSQMSVLTGRRRIGKTKLILRSCVDSPTVYFSVCRNCKPFVKHVYFIRSDIICKSL